MLHALLHGKLSESIPEPDRLEDALTSSVFGTLVLVEAVEVVWEWLRQARDLSGDPVPDDHVGSGWDCWFWPHLAYAEPDLALRIGDRLFLVEAKYKSGRHDAVSGEAEDERALSDQLHRQHASIELVRKTEVHVGTSKLEAAIKRCHPTLVYLVDQRRARSARREFRESAAAIPDADLRFLTWQRLYVVLCSSGPGERWRRDLLRYLDACGLDAFVGFTFRRDPAAHPRQFIRAWRSAGSGTGLVRSVRSIVGSGAEVGHRLRCWAVRKRSEGGLRHGIAALGASRRANAVCAWRVSLAGVGFGVGAGITRATAKTPPEVARAVRGFGIHEE